MTRAPIVRSRFIVLIWLWCAACTHVVRRRFDCYDPAPIGKSAISWERGAGSGISGRMLSPTGMRPLDAGEVTIARLGSDSTSAGTTRRTGTDSLGAFHFDSVLAGHYRVTARRIGYVAVRDSLVVARDSAVSVTALLVKQYLVLDECGLTYYEERVPWWKW